MATKQERNLPNLKIQKMTKAIYDQVQGRIGPDDLVFVEDHDEFFRKTSLKTINGESIVGEGNIEVQGGGGAFVAEYGVTTYDALTQEVNAGKEVICFKNNMVYRLIYSDTLYHHFSLVVQEAVYSFKVSKDNVWSDPVAKALQFKTYMIRSTQEVASSDENYYSCKKVDNLLDNKQATLVSGSNIKTINGESIVGEGDIQIQGGGTFTYDEATETLRLGGNN